MTSVSSVTDVVEPVVLPVVRVAVAVPAVVSPLRPALLGAPAPGAAHDPSAPSGGLLLWALLGLLAGLATWPRARRFVLMLSA